MRGRGGITPGLSFADAAWRLKAPPPNSFTGEVGEMRAGRSPDPKNLPGNGRDFDPVEPGRFSGSRIWPVGVILSPFRPAALTWRRCGLVRVN